MLFCFTTSKKVGSRLIRWGLGEDCSHFALVFDEGQDGYGIVLHSDQMGVRLCWWHDFQETHEVVHSLRLKKSMSLGQEESFYRAIISRFYGQPYDFRALAFWAWRVLLKKTLGLPIPGRNAWGQPNAFLCTGIAAALREPVFSILKLNSLHLIPDTEMISPHRLYSLLRESPMLEEAGPWVTPKTSQTCVSAS